MSIPRRCAEAAEQKPGTQSDEAKPEPTCDVIGTEEWLGDKRKGHQSDQRTDVGSTVEKVRDPLGYESTTEWDLQQVKVKSRTDANGVTTSYTYDQYGNIKTESVGNEIARSFNYYPPVSSSRIKNRVEYLYNRNGNRTDDQQCTSDGEQWFDCQSD